MPNNNDAMCITYNCAINYHRHSTILNGGYLVHDHAEKGNLGNRRDNDIKTRKVHADGNKHCPGKE